VRKKEKDKERKGDIVRKRLLTWQSRLSGTSIIHSEHTVYGEIEMQQFGTVTFAPWGLSRASRDFALYLYLQQTVI
jgi:hypothetical protein